MTNTKRHKERGVALIAVIIAIAITIVISGEFGNATTTDIQAAANYRDQMRAHFLARSAQNLGELVLRIQKQLDGQRKNIGPVQITDFADQLILPFCGGDQEVRDMIGFSTSDVEGLGAEIGTCGFNGAFGTEDNKINLNCANNQASFVTLQTALEGLVYFQAYDPVFEEADAEGWRRDRKMQVAALLDYIDTDTMKLKDRGTSEDYGYESLRDRYKAKNNYVDSLDELKLVRGVDDRFWTLFGSALTVYGGCKINLETLDNPQLIAAILLVGAAKDEQLVNDPVKVFALAGVIAKAKQFGETFDSVDDFVKFVEDPSAAITALASTGGMQGTAAQSALAQGGLMPGGQKLGMKLDAQKLKTILLAGEARRTYRVEAYGEIARKQTDNEGRPVYPPVRSTITGVWDWKFTPQNSRKAGTPAGWWVFLRED